ncbi:DNA helicase [Rhizocola hellebori]|uniref:DNA helicase n=1 Tax=Rhizocola hellebori TaxID=1392758 RepID=A0A8J3VHN5_9ACTN|nr:AAA family ATPase [Rhizocola hellebori]GIH06103.1 DNA helicase [Rhizocola hellebori]
MSGDAQIQAERDYLAAARAALLAMHEDVVATETPLTSSEDNNYAWQNNLYLQVRAERAVALIDLPGVPLFFGRLDFEPGVVYTTDRVYIGRRHVHDSVGKPMVVDWRAPISTAFYRATRSDAQGVRLRRRYGFSDTAELTAYEDEPLVGQPGGFQSALVMEQIERPRSGPMRDIVATIQPEQDDLVRAPTQPALCIQGAPGTGKTAVGLHRLAYLLYTERERLGRHGGVAVVGPNRSFLTYIRHVLPALGEVDIIQTTVEDLIGRDSALRGEQAPTARLKGEARMAALLRRALWAHISPPSEDFTFLKGSIRYRVGNGRIQEMIESLRGNTRYGAGRDAVAQRLAHLVLLQMERRGAVPDDRDQEAVARSKPVKQFLESVWPKLIPQQVLFRLYSQPSFLASCAEGELTEAEQQLLTWAKPYRSWKSAQWSAADSVLLDELADQIERGPSLGHLVVDEAQDLSPMQCRALGRRCVSGSVTVLGDIAQGTSVWAIDDWPQLLEHLGKPDARLAVLEQGFRVPAQILDYAARLLPQIAPGLGVPTSVRHANGSLQVTQTRELGAAVVAACRLRLNEEGSIGVIAPDADIASVHKRLCAEGLQAALLGETEDALEVSRLVCVPATLAKGLEFDAVVVAEPARIVAAEPRGIQRLYVALTRAVSSLHVIHTEPLPDALAS